LAGLAHPDGGWGYASDRAAGLEPTCLALLALATSPSAATETVVEQGRQLLARCRQPDRSYRTANGREEAVWPTALVLFVQVELGFPADELRRTAARLLGARGRAVDDPKAAEVQDIDLRRIGWPWAEGNFSWVEPTAWACLALRKAGFGDHPRVREGLGLLLDRAFDEGGINYGNRRIFDRMTEPIPGPTALMLLALQGQEHPRITSAVAYLRQEVLVRDDLEDLCWAKLAMYQYDPAKCHVFDDRIRAAHAARQSVPWLRPSPVREALTALALATEQKNPFRLAGAGAQESSATQHSALGTQHSPGKPWSHRFKAYFRGRLIEGMGRLRPLPPQSAVHIAPVNDYNADLAGLLREQYAAFRERVPLAGKRVVLKPNLVEYHRDKVINTDPRVVAAVIELCKREGAGEVVVAEGPGHWRNVEFIVAASGLGDVLRHYQVPFVDLNHDEPKRLLNLGRLTRLEHLFLANTVATADVLISLPKLKTHHWAGATLSLKNLFGVLPGACYGWPKNELHWRGIENSIVDIALTRTPDLAIVDGIVGMEGDGPLNGTAKPLGALVLGCDPVAVDATCCRLMQLDPERVGYLALAYQKKLGRVRVGEIPQVGEKIDRLAKPFATLPQFEALYQGRSA
jgi:uncharacterized protein (DUF362 family)